MRPSRSGPTRDASTIAARWSPQRCPTRLSKIGPSTASSRMQRDSNPRSPVIGTTVVEAIPFAHPGTSPCGSLCTRKWRPLLIPGSPQCDRRWPPAGAGNPRFSSCAPRWARIWLPKWPQTRIYSAMSVWGVVKVRSWLGNSRIVQFHAIGTGILGRTLWRTLHLNPSI